MLTELINNERRYLDYFFENLDLKVAEEILELFYRCKGLIVFTGVGKSETIAQKISATMTSTGTRSLFLEPTNALHGDIGILSEQDLFVIISKSGESEELLNLIPFIRNRGTKVIAIVSNGTSRLALASDIHIVLPLQKELCPFDLVPTISAQIQIIFGDLMTVGLMRLKNFSLDEYAQNHPAGRIGRRISIKVSDLMVGHSSLPICKPQDKVINTLVELSKKRCGCVLVANEDKKLEGIFTDGDLGRALTSGGPAALDEPIASLMVSRPKCIRPDALAWEALQTMEADQKNPITVLAVTDHSDKILGLIRMHDIVQAGI